MALTRSGNCKNDFQHNWFKHRKDFPMNELSVIGSLCLSTDFQDRTGQTLQLARKKYMAKYVLTSKIAILEKDYRFFSRCFIRNGNFRILAISRQEITQQSHFSFQTLLSLLPVFSSLGNTKERYDSYLEETGDRNGVLEN